MRIPPIRTSRTRLAPDYYRHRLDRLTSGFNEGIDVPNGDPAGQPAGTGAFLPNRLYQLSVGYVTGQRVMSLPLVGAGNRQVQPTEKQPSKLRKPSGRIWSGCFINRLAGNAPADLSPVCAAGRREGARTTRDGREIVQQQGRSIGREFVMCPTGMVGFARGEHRRDRLGE